MTVTAGSRERLDRAVLELDGATLTIADALEVSRRGRTVRLAESAAQAIRTCRELKVSLISEEIPIYGVTTGLGDSAHRQVSSAKSARLQRNLIRFLGCGTGPITAREVVRVAMLLRANCLAKGNSGVRVELVGPLLELLN